MHVRDPVSVTQPPFPSQLPTHNVRGVDVRAGRQQDLHHLLIPSVRRRVKWGVLVLRGERSGKDNTHGGTTKQRRKRGG